jgi:RNA polymerase sigma-70 factor, ECF subfamily
MDDRIDDGQLVAALQAGQQQALGQIYDRYSGLVYRLALKMSATPGDAEDLTQEVFLAFWRGVDRYDPQRGALPTFLLTITRSRALNKLRQGQSQQNLMARYEQNLSTHPTDNLAGAQLAELSERMGAALAQIPRDQQQALSLAYYEGLSQGAIADRLQIPLGTVKTRCRQGLLKLQRLLQDLKPQP